MEFKHVVGNRRSIRYYLPYRPVEKSKIQTILQAARLQRVQKHIPRSERSLADESGGR